MRRQGRVSSVALLILLLGRCLGTLAGASTPAAVAVGPKRLRAVPVRNQRASVGRLDPARRRLQKNDKNKDDDNQGDVSVSPAPTSAPTITPTLLPMTESSGEPTLLTLMPTSEVSISVSNAPATRVDDAASVIKRRFLPWILTLESNGGGINDQEEEGLLDLVQVACESFLLESIRSVYDNTRRVSLWVELTAPDRSNRNLQNQDIRSWTFLITGSVAFRETAPPRSDVLALQRDLIVRQREASMQQLQDLLEEEMADAEYEFEGRITNLGMAPAPEDDPLPDTADLVSPAALGGSLAGAAVCLLVAAAFITRRQRMRKRKILMQHVSLSNDHQPEDSDDCASTSTSKRSSDHFAADMNARCSQLVFTSAEESADYGNDSVVRPRELVAELAGEEHDIESLQDDDYSLSSYTNQIDYASPSTTARPSGNETTFVPVRVSRKTHSYKEPSQQSALGHLYTREDNDDSDNDVYISDTESLFTQGTLHTYSTVQGNSHAETPSLVAAETNSTGAGQTVLISNKSQGITVESPIRGGSSTSSAARTGEQEDGVFDSDAEFDELMGPMPQLNLAPSAEELKIVSLANMTSMQPNLLDTMRGRQVKKREGDSFEESSQPSDEALDEEDRNLVGFQLDVEASVSNQAEEI